MSLTIEGQGLSPSELFLKIMTKTLGSREGDILEIKVDTPELEEKVNEWIMKTQRTVCAKKKEMGITSIQIKL